MKHWRAKLVNRFQNPTTFLAIAAAFTITMPLAAQADESAAPIRIACETYGGPSGSSGGALALRLDATGAKSTNLVVVGGEAKDFAFLLIGAAKTHLPGLLDTTILARPDVFLSLGQFNGEEQMARMPIDLLRTDLIGGTVYMQGLRVSAEPVGMWMSAGLAVRFAPGSIQPALDYDGPASTAILIANVHDELTHQMLHRVLAPTTGWALTETSRQSDGDTTRIYMTLREPALGGTVMETKRAFIDLGVDAQPVIELWIRMTTEVSGRVAPYRRAARIERDF